MDKKEDKLEKLTKKRKRFKLGIFRIRVLGSKKNLKNRFQISQIKQYEQIQGLRGA